MTVNSTSKMLAAMIGTNESQSSNDVEIETPELICDSKPQPSSTIPEMGPLLARVLGLSPTKDYSPMD